MGEPLELEIELFRGNRREQVTVTLRLNDPSGDQVCEPAHGSAVLPGDLPRTVIGDFREYGEQLFSRLFADDMLRRYYDDARRVAKADGRRLRLRLCIEPTLSDLHELRWETLTDYRDREWLLETDLLSFSRFLAGKSGKPRPLRGRGELRTLVAIANPADLEAEDYRSAKGGQRLHRVDVAKEKRRAKGSLQDLYDEDCALTSDPLNPGIVTMPKLCQRLRDGFDVVYLVSHGALIKKGDQRGPQLLLEGPDGRGQAEPAKALADEIAQMVPELRPRLFVLASCESAGGPVTADELGILAGIGPQLVGAGVPAVIAMQGSVSMSTAGQFVQTFFAELLNPERGGWVDVAATAARRDVGHCMDAWMPVLYTNLKVPIFSREDLGNEWVELSGLPQRTFLAAERYLFDHDYIRGSDGESGIRAVTRKGRSWLDERP